MLRFLTAGESHGPGLVTIVEGLPAGLEVTVEGLSAELSRRRQGHGRGARMAIELDELEILAGVRAGYTLGSPVAVLIRNTEWPKWSKIMSPAAGHNPAPVTRPRPGHADLAGMLKYDTVDARDILERASARETAARTVAGYLARSLIGVGGATVLSHVTGIGEVVAVSDVIPTQADVELIDQSPVRCFDAETSRQMVELIDTVAQAKDTLGGEFEVVAHGVPPGVGSHVHYDRRLDTALGAALMSIQSVKAVAVGEGFEIGTRLGSSAHDEIVVEEGELTRSTNRAGGVEAGMSNGQPIVARAIMKPISTLMKPLASVDMSSGEAESAVRERSDVCAVPAGAVVGEQMVCWVLAVEMLRKFGGDTVKQFQDSLTSYQADMAERTSW